MVDTKSAAKFCHWHLRKTLNVKISVPGLKQIFQPALTALLFLSPVFYPLSSVPTALQPVYLANPVTYVSETLRGVLLHQTLPDPLSWLVFTGISLLVAWLGLSLFQTTRKGFADVI